MSPQLLGAASDLLEPVVFASLAAAFVPAAVLASAAQDPPDGPAPRAFTRRASRALGLVALALAVVVAQAGAVLVLATGGHGLDVDPLAWPLLAATGTAAALVAVRAVPVLLVQRGGVPVLDAGTHWRGQAAARAAAVAAAVGALLVVLSSGAPPSPVGPSVLPVVTGAGLVLAGYATLLTARTSGRRAADSAVPGVCHDARHAPGPRLVRR